LGCPIVLIYEVFKGILNSHIDVLVLLETLDVEANDLVPQLNELLHKLVLLQFLVLHQFVSLIDNEVQEMDLQMAERLSHS
jgi:hypothetical protein